MRSLRVRLLFIVSVALAPALALQAWIEHDADRVRQKLVEEEAQRLVLVVADQQQRIAEAADEALSAIANSPSVQSRDADGCQLLLAGLLAQAPRYNSASVHGLDGKLICAGAPVPPGFTVADRIFFRLALQSGGFVIGDYTIGRISGRPTLHMARPFRDATGQLAGVVVVALNLDWLGRQLEGLGLPPEAAVSVSDRAGIVIARHPDGPRYVGRRESAAALATFQGEHVGVTAMQGLDGRPRVVGFSPPGAPPLGLRIGVGLDRERAFAAVTSGHRLGLALIMLGAAAGLLVTALLGGPLIGRPVERLLAASRRWSEGDLAARTGLRHERSEFGRLAAGFDAMAEALQARERELKERERELRATESELRRLTGELESRVQAEVAAREAAQLRAALAERLQALGQLAAGIAHDFNNVLQSVVAAAGLIERQPGDATLVGRWVRVATEASARGAAISRRLLAFGRRGDLSPEAIDAAALLEDLRELFDHTLGPEIEVVLRAQAGLPPLLADRGQLETVLVNLAANARDAMPDGGRLTLSAATATAADCRDAGCLPAGASPVGAYVRITVADSGIGMDALTLARATEPFFTTKGPGHGSGLGLPMARGFAEQSGGVLDLSSRLGEGTTVTLWLPQASPQAVSAAPVAPPAEAPGARLLVLLVDDEPLLREVLSEYLEDWHCSVRVASGGVEALALLDAGEAVDVLVTDLSMPGMDGVALIRAAQARRPGLPAILLTGYAGEAALADAGFTLMRKPVRGADLVDRITALTAATA